MKLQCLRVFLLVVVLFVIAGCDGKNFTPQGPDSEPDIEEENPIPVLTSVTPTSCVSHVPAFEMKVEGSDFTEGATIVFRGNEMDTTFVDANHLTCLIQPDETLLSAAAQAGHYDREVGSAQAANALVKVRNPSPGGGDSNTMDFSICNNYTFSEPKQLVFDNVLAIITPNILVEPDGTVDFLCHQPTVEDWQWGFEGKLFLRRSRDGGETWEEPLQMTKHPPNAPTSPQLVLDRDGTMHCVHLRDGGFTYYHCSKDGGYNWRKPVRLPSDYEALYYGNSRFHFCVPPTGVIHVLFQEDHAEKPSGFVYYGRSDDGGSHWDVRLMSEPASGICPHIAADDDGHAYAVWMRRSERSVHKTQWYLCYARSDDNGRHWTKPEVWNTSPNRDYTSSIELTVNPVNNHVYMTYYYNKHGYFIKSTDYGKTWSEPFIVAGNNRTSGYVCLLVDVLGNINAIFYQDGVYKFRRSVDEGKNWSVPVTVFSRAHDCAYYKWGIDDTGAITVMLDNYVGRPLNYSMLRANPVNP